MQLLMLEIQGQLTSLKVYLIMVRLLLGQLEVLALPEELE